jgi:Putative ABC exporter
MNGVAALAYLEGRMAINRFRQIVHQPGRLVLWMLFVGWLALFFFTRVSHVSGIPYGMLFPDGLHLAYAFVPAAYIMLLGFQIRSGSRRPPAAFAYPADARFLFGSRLNHVLVICWLQLREVAFSGSRIFLGLFFVAWNFAGSAGGLALATVALLCAYVIAFGIRLPVFLAQRRMPEIPFGTFGAALMGAGLLTLLFPVALALASGSTSWNFIASQTAVFAPGSWIVEALAGNHHALFALVALACAVVACGSLAANDAYPELWEASARLYALRALVASGRSLWNREALRNLQEANSARSPVRIERAASSDGRRVPVGSLVVVWKEWVALRRSPGGLSGLIFWVAGAAALGYLIGTLAKAIALVVLLGPLVAIANIFIVAGSQSTINLGSELRRPIWWLAISPLRYRILAWVAGTTMRIGPPLLAGAFAAGISVHSWLVAVAGAALIFAGLFLVQSIGVASYVILPGRNDLRGPGFMLRILVTYLSLLPPLLAWALIQVGTSNAPLGMASALVIGCGEAWFLSIFAAARLEQNALEYASADQH